MILPGPPAVVSRNVTFAGPLNPDINQLSEIQTKEDDAHPCGIVQSTASVIS